MRPAVHRYVRVSKFGVGCGISDWVRGTDYFFILISDCRSARGTGDFVSVTLDAFW